MIPRYLRNLEQYEKDGVKYYIINDNIRETILKNSKFPNFLNAHITNPISEDKYNRLVDLINKLRKD